MANFKIDFGKDFEALRKNLQQDATLARIVPDLTISMLKLNNTLERRVNELFNAPGTLSDVMRGRTIKPSELGKSFIKFSLQYEDKPIPLIEYGVTQSGILPGVESIAPLTKEPLGAVHWKKGNYSRKVTVQIRKGTTVGTRLGGNFSGLSGFLIDKNGRSGVFARTTGATWDRYPKEGFAGTRAPIVELYGPSLAQLASKVFDKDKQVDNAVLAMQDSIINAILRI